MLFFTVLCCGSETNRCKSLSVGVLACVSCLCVHCLCMCLSAYWYTLMQISNETMCVCVSCRVLAKLQVEKQRTRPTRHQPPPPLASSFVIGSGGRSKLLPHAPREKTGSWPSELLRSKLKISRKITKPRNPAVEGSILSTWSHTRSKQKELW